MLVAQFSSWSHDILQPTLYHSLLTQNLFDNPGQVKPCQDPQEIKQMVMMAAG